MGYFDQIEEVKLPMVWVMITLNKHLLNRHLLALALGFGVAVSAWPSFAQIGQNSNFAVSPAERNRLADVQECMVKAGKMKTYVDTIGQTEVYKNCMVERGYQP